MFIEAPQKVGRQQRRTCSPKRPSRSLDSTSLEVRGVAARSRLTLLSKAQWFHLPLADAPSRKCYTGPGPQAL